MRTEQKAVLLAGGDRRSTELARLLAARPEFLVFALGLGEGLPRPEEGFQADILILPVPATSDGVCLKAPQAGERLPIETALSFVKPGGKVYGGLTGAGKGIPALCAERGADFADFLADEAFTRLNAEATAEVMLALLILDLPVCLPEAEVAVLGGGRIAKGLARRLIACGGRCTLAARNPAQRAEAEALGAETAPLDRLSDILPGADAVLNTIPAPVVDGETAARIPPQALVYELASAPGGFTPEALRIRAVKPALSLPGKYAPLSCARWMERLILQENLKEGFV